MTLRLVARGPHFEELTRGQVFDSAPGVTLTPGMAAVHQAILGNRLRLALDDRLAAAVTGRVAWPPRAWCGTWRSGSRRP